MVSITFFSNGDGGTPSISVQVANLWYDIRDAYIVRFVVDGCRKNLPLDAPSETMSFIHYTIVGHFDPATLNPSNIVPTRPLSKVAVDTLLAESDAQVNDYIEYRDGYLQCCWAGGFAHSIGKLVHEFAYKLAERENCVGAELPLCVIEYPPEAVEVQRRVIADYQS